MTTIQLDAAAAASAFVLKGQLCEVQKLLHKINQAQESMKEQLSNSKYQIRKMDVGSIDDFHKGLADRIGKCHFGAQFVFSHSLVEFGRVTQSGL